MQTASAALRQKAEEWRDNTHKSGFFLLTLFVIGVIGVFIFDITTMGITGLCGIVLTGAGVYAGALFISRISPTFSIFPRVVRTRQGICFIAILVSGLGGIWQLLIVTQKCTDPTYLAGNPALNQVCTQSYAMLIVSIVYAFVLTVYFIIQIAFETMIYKYVMLDEQLNRASPAEVAYITARPANIAPPRLYQPGTQHVLGRINNNTNNNRPRHMNYTSNRIIVQR